MSGGDHVGEISAAALWRALLDLRRHSRSGAAAPPLGLVAEADGALAIGSPEAAAIVIASDGGWCSDRQLLEDQRRLLDLYLPFALAGPRRPLTVAHLGQSLDGRIATETGHSHYVTGQANLAHLHRLRALCDAVVVGAGTVAADDPQLTVRLVEGPHPVRVVIDPRCRLGGDHGLFRDGQAPTLRLCTAGAAMGAGDEGGEVLALAAEDGRLDTGSIVAALHARGLFVLLVEGGGVTVSRFLEEGTLDRLQVAVAPLVIGSGRPGLSLPPIERLDAALRPNCRTHLFGDEVLFDCALGP